VRLQVAVFDFVSSARFLPGGFAHARII
jgi:hypothetical protein